MCPRSSQRKKHFWTQDGEGSSWDSAGNQLRKPQRASDLHSSRASALGVAVTIDPLPSKTGDLELQRQWKAVQNIRNIFLVGLICFCQRH